MNKTIRPKGIFFLFKNMYKAQGLDLKKKFRFMLFTVKTLHKFRVYRYLELKRYLSFAFIVITFI